VPVIMASYLHFHSLEKHYGPVRALADVDLVVEQGSVLALLGPNGAGKTTLFGCLLGLVRPANGEIHLRGKSIADCDRRRFGYLAERVALYPQRTVLENGLLFARLKSQSAAELECQLKRVGLYTVQDRPVRQLSKGMLQRLGLAIALCGQPELLVLDEPFNGLDPALLDGLQGILREEQARGRRVVFVGDGTTDFQAARHADHVFARAKLAAYCRQAGLPYTPFATFAAVRAGVEALLG